MVIFIEWIEQNLPDFVVNLKQKLNTDLPLKEIFDKSEEHLKLLCDNLNAIIYLRNALIGYSYILPKDNFPTTNAYAEYLCNLLNDDFEKHSKLTKTNRTTVKSVESDKCVVRTNSHKNLNNLVNDDTFPSFKTTMHPFFTNYRITQIVLPDEKKKVTIKSNNFYYRIVSNDGNDISTGDDITVQIDDENINNDVNQGSFVFPMKLVKGEYDILTKGCYLIIFKATIVLEDCTKKLKEYIENKKQYYTKPENPKGEITLLKETIPLKCNISQLTIEYPVRCESCGALLDIRSMVSHFIHMRECPVCKKNIGIENIKKDVFFMEILENSPKGAEYVEISEEGIKYLGDSKTSTINIDEEIDVDEIITDEEEEQKKNRERNLYIKQ